MDRSHFISRTKEMLLEDLVDESITYYLKEEGADPASIPSIIEEAKAEFVEEQVRKYTKQNKLYFWLWTTLSSAAFIFMLFVLPYFDVAVNHASAFSFLGAAAVSFSGFLVFFYHRARREDFIRKYGRPKIRYAFILLLWVPGLVFYYIFSARFSAAQDDQLKQTQVEVTGRVVSGTLHKMKKLLSGAEVGETAYIAVEFETKDGQKIVVTKEVNASAFTHFYKDEEVHIIYSKANPHNIDLLDNDENVRYYKGTQEKDLDATDLMRLVNLNPQNLGEELNKLSYGWSYLQGKDIWVNEKRQCAVGFRGNELIFIGKDDYNYTYPTFLQEKGFRMINKEDRTDLMHTGKKIFDNGKFIFTVQADGMPDSAHAVITVAKK